MRKKEGLYWFLRRFYVRQSVNPEARVVCKSSEKFVWHMVALRDVNDRRLVSVAGRPSVGVLSGNGGMTP